MYVCLYFLKIPKLFLILRFNKQTYLSIHPKIFLLAQIKYLIYCMKQLD